MWESSKFFSDKYISIGWNLNFANSFPHCDYVACDTETKLYYDGELSDCGLWIARYNNTTTSNSKSGTPFYGEVYPICKGCFHQ